jgi:hypothetical protein
VEKFTLVGEIFHFGCRPGQALRTLLALATTALLGLLLGYVLHVSWCNLQCCLSVFKPVKAVVLRGYASDGCLHTGSNVCYGFCPRLWHLVVVCRTGRELYAGSANYPGIAPVPDAPQVSVYRGGGGGGVYRDELGVTYGMGTGTSIGGAVPCSSCVLTGQAYHSL